MTSFDCRQKLQGFLHDCVASSPVEQADRIREAYLLFREMSEESGLSVEAALDEFDLDALLMTGAYESAALAFLTPETSFMMSRGVNGNCLATVSLSGAAREMTAEAGTLALALLAALASALIAQFESGPG